METKFIMSPPLPHNKKGVWRHQRCYEATHRRLVESQEDDGQCAGENWNIQASENQAAFAGSQEGHRAFDHVKGLQKQKLWFRTSKHLGFEIQDLGEKGMIKKWVQL